MPKKDEVIGDLRKILEKEFYISHCPPHSMRPHPTLLILFCEYGCGHRIKLGRNLTYFERIINNKKYFVIKINNYKMEQLMTDSVKILKEEDNLQVIYDWMDAGDVISKKQRNNLLINTEYQYIIDELIKIIKMVKLEDNIVLYRGMTNKIGDNIIHANQFSALSPNINTAKTYANNIMEVFVSKGSNAFYISAWEVINTDVEEQEEKEVLLLPGYFTLYKKYNSYVTYIYTQY